MKQGNFFLRLPIILYIVQIFLFVLILILIAACGKKGDTIITHLPAPNSVAPEQIDDISDTDSDISSIQSLVDDENKYRLGLGQTKLSPGLSCLLQTVTSGDRIQSSVPGHNQLSGKATVGTFLLTKPVNQENTSINSGLNILPQPLRALYKNMFYLQCTGYIVITETNYHDFSLTSDDAGLLYIANSKIIDLDNSHAAQTKTAAKYLRAGVHAIKLQFAQTGGGSQALIIMHNSEILDSKLYFH